MQQIVQGGAVTLTVRLNQVTNGVVGDPVDLTGITNITTCFQNADGTETMLTLLGGAVTVLGNPVLGKLAIAVTAAQSTLFEIVSVATLQLALVYGSADPIMVQIPNAYSVVQSVC